MAAFDVNWKPLKPLKIDHFERSIVAEKIYLQPMVRFKCDFALLETVNRTFIGGEQKK